MHLFHFIKNLYIELNKFQGRDFKTPEQKRFLINKLIHQDFASYFIGKNKMASFGYNIYQDIQIICISILKIIGKYIKKIGHLIIQYLITIGYFIVDRYYDVLYGAELYKLQLVRGLSYIAAGFVIVTLIVNIFVNYEYYYCDRLLGTVRSPYEVYHAIEAVNTNLVSYYDAEIDLKNDIIIKKVYGGRSEFDTQDDVVNTLTYMKGMQATGYSIVVNNEPLLIVKDINTAEQILQDYTEYYHNYDDEHITLYIGIIDDIQIIKVKTLLGDIGTEENAKNYVITHKVFKLKYEIYGTFLETINFNVQYFAYNSKLLYNNFKIIKIGNSGIQSCKETRIIVDDEVVEKTILDATVIQNATDAHILIDDISSSRYIFPLGRDTVGYVSSPYGARGNTHLAIDLGCIVNSYVYSCSEGTVIKTGGDTALGWSISIVDPYGYTFIYGHLNSCMVSVGDYVAQGQLIGLSGSTGNATGPHLHLAVYNSDNNPINPGTIG